MTQRRDPWRVSGAPEERGHERRRSRDVRHRQRGALLAPFDQAEDAR